MSDLSLLSDESRKSARLSDADDDASSSASGEDVKEKRGEAARDEGGDENDALLAEEYDPFKKRRRFELYVPPRMYNPYTSTQASGVGWKYEPEDVFGRWDSSYLPPQPSHDKAETSALKEQLSVEAAVTGELPLDIHSHLQQLRTDLLGGVAAGVDLTPEAQDDGRVVDVNILEKSHLAFGGCTAGNGPTAYLSQATSAKPLRRAAHCTAVDTQLTSHIPPRVKEAPQSQAPAMTSLSERLAKLRGMR
eukprot:TRINITY_DN25654_c0_g1_i1.p1 TRINITY_DN25654_c0_g1~~TRINITY_DN25654_c0_g1_i1.p1  ORF type:complete len:249 (+),score=106.57 TRINITY_DN25654_c0_g1_i1:75-821(+)